MNNKCHHPGVLYFITAKSIKCWGSNTINFNITITYYTLVYLIYIDFIRVNTKDSSPQYDKGKRKGNDSSDTILI